MVMIYCNEVLLLFHSLIMHSVLWCCWLHVMRAYGLHNVALGLASKCDIKSVQYAFKTALWSIFVKRIVC